MSARPVDLSEVHVALDRLRRQLCHCGMQGECLGCKGVEMIRSQVEAVAAAAGQPVLLQVAQEAAAKDMAERFQGMAETLLNDPEIRNAAQAMQEKFMADPELRRLMEEMMRRLGQPPDESPPGGG